jgi:hypothetical protein
MFKSLSVALALAIAGATTLTPGVEAASIRAPGLSTERLVTPIASKKYKKYKAKKCKKGKLYSKRRHKCVWKKKRYRAKMVAPAKAIAPRKKK